MIRRRLLISAATFASLGTMAGASVQAQEDAYPSRPITLVVQSVPGALPDQAARIYSERLSSFLKQSVVIENVSGAGGMIAFRRVAGARPDGYTLLVAVNTVIAQPLLNPKAGYAMKDYTVVGELARAYSLLVTSAESPYKRLDDLLEAARKNPGTISYGSTGVGTTGHLNVEMLADRAKVKFLHVPYKGVAAAVPDVVGQRLNFVMPTASSTSELVRSGALRALSISSATRSQAYPDVPTLAELGYPDSGFEVWCAVFAPAGLPPAVLDKLAQALEYARSDQSLVSSFAATGQYISNLRTPAQFAAAVEDETVKLQSLIKAANIVIE